MVPDTASTDNGNAPRTNPVADATTATKNHFASYDGVPPQNEIITVATTAYLDAIEPTDPPSPETIEKQLLASVNGVVKMVNPKASTTLEKLPLKRVLTPWQIAQVLLRLDHVAHIVFTGSDRMAPLGIYASDGTDRGTYVINERTIRQRARAYNTQLSLNEFKEVLAVLDEEAPRIVPNSNRDITGVNNGIVNYRTKQLLPFDPSIVLLSKIRVDYVENPSKHVISGGNLDGTDWEFTEWYEALFDQPDEIDLAWKALGAVVRPLVRWDKALMLYNESGNNGKGTVMSLMRNLVGEASWAPLSINDFSQKFRLPEIVNKVGFGADENPVGAFTDDMAAFKATVTGDIVMIERKRKDPFGYRPSGVMAQCINSLPESKDVSESNYRRTLFWLFKKRFEGAENKAIKDDYLKRREVLEYVLWHVLNMPDYYELPVPESSRRALEKFKETNDPVREFWAEMEDELAWRLQPQEFLHDLFMAWSARANPRSGGIKKLKFYNRLKAVVAEDSRWEDGQWGTSDRMSAPEPLIADYDLKWWKCPAYGGSDRMKIGQPKLKPKYRGLLRVDMPPTPAGIAPDPAAREQTDRQATSAVSRANSDSVADLTLADEERRKAEERREQANRDLPRLRTELEALEAAGARSAEIKLARLLVENAQLQAVMPADDMKEAI